MPEASSASGVQFGQMSSLAFGKRSASALAQAAASIFGQHHAIFWEVVMGMERMLNQADQRRVA